MPIIQDNVGENHCYGCGADNPLGMQIKSHWDGDETVCTYTPRPEQSAGPLQYLYGGTIASLIDCHSVGTAIAHFYAGEQRTIGSEPLIWCVTGRLTVNYLKPTPIGRPVVLTASVRESTDKKAIVVCKVTSGADVTAEGEVVAVRVPYSWRE